MMYSYMYARIFGCAVEMLDFKSNCYVRREMRMKAKSERSSTLAWAKAFLFSTTRTTVNCCSPSTCSHWWPFSSPTSLWIRSCVLSAKHLEKTSRTVRKTATKDVSILSSQSNRDLSHDEHSHFETNKM